MMHQPRFNRRSLKRLRCLVPTLILGGKPLRFSRTLVHNFSDAGFYFESPYPFEAGDYIVARADGAAVIDPIASGIRNTRHAQIKWCLKKEAGRSLLYGCGAQYVPPAV